MAECIILKAGGGTGSDDCTAIQEYVLEGYTAVTSDSDDEPAEGTLPNNGGVQMAEKLETSSTANELRARIPYGYYEKENYQGSILSPYIRMPYSNVRSAIGYTNSAKVLNDTTIAGLKGTMTNVASIDPAKSISLSNGVLYVRMTNGAHVTNATSGYPEVSIPQATLASGIGLTEAKIAKGQTILGKAGTYTSDATASAPYIRKGYTAYVNGNKITGSMSVSSLVSFSVAAYSTSQVQCTWKWPSKGPYSGVAICGKTGGYPSNINDSRLYTGYGTSYSLNSTSTATISGLSAGTTYYFRIWAYCTCSSGDIYSNYSQATCKVTSHGQTTLTSSGTWTVPAGVRSIDICCVGGGGGGAGAYVWRTGSDHSYSADCTSGGGGAGGYVVTKTGVAVTPGQKHTVVIGSGGTGGGWVYSTDDSVPTPGWSSTNGGKTSLGSLCSANGGARASGRGGGDNGTGYGKGGSGALNREDDAGNGGAGLSTFAGTRGGGGGGGNYGYNNNGDPWYGANGSGGSGGGGKGGWCNGTGSATNPTSGSANTGGGGGGGWVRSRSSDGNGSNGANGGSGVIIIKW